MSATPAFFTRHVGGPLGIVRSDRVTPVIGVLAAMLGTMLALILMPSDPTVKGALVAPAAALAAGLLFVPAVRLVFGSPFLLNAENFVAIGFVYWILLDPIQSAYDLFGVSETAIRSTFIAVGTFGAAMWLGVLGRPVRLPRSFVRVVERPLTASTIARIVPVCFALGMAQFVYATHFDVPLMFSYLGAPRWSAPWGRGQLGGWDAFLDHTQYFGYALPSLAALLGVRRGWLKASTILSVGAALIMVLFLSQGGGRRIVGVTVGAAILTWTLASPGLKISKLLTVAGAAVALLAAMQFMLEIRTTGYQDYLANRTSVGYLHVDDNFLRIAQTIEIVPDAHPYAYWRQIAFILVRPIPRVFWPGKPVDPGFDLPSLVGLKGVSLSNSIVGEWYLTFGWLAVAFGGWLHGRLASAANALRDRTVLSRNPIAFALAVMVLFSGIRSMQDLIIMSYAIVAWFGVAWLATRRRQDP